MPKIDPIPAAETHTAPADDDTPRYRSAAVARMVRMPVATLRVWERRYQVAMPQVSASGQRLYSAADIQRLALIRQLTELGHAISALAALDAMQLQAVAATHLSAGARPIGAPAGDGVPTRSGGDWRVAVVGTALAARLARTALSHHIGRGVQWLGPFDSIADAAAAIGDGPVDAVLAHAPTLHPDWLAERDAAAPILRALPTALLYGFASDSLCASLAAAGVTLLREPQNDTVLGQWLRTWRSVAGAAPLAQADARASVAAVPAPRWSAASLAGFASQSNTITCQCPRHIAELLVQLIGFETYSSECESRNSADAALHSHLGQVAGAARAQLEQALERVALSEGLALPA